MTRQPRPEHTQGFEAAAWMDTLNQKTGGQSALNATEPVLKPGPLR